MFLTVFINHVVYGLSEDFRKGLANLLSAFLADVFLEITSDDLTMINIFSRMTMLHGCMFECWSVKITHKGRWIDCPLSQALIKSF